MTKKISTITYLISHSGMKEDKVVARKFPEIDWITVHTHKITQKTVDVGETNLFKCYQEITILVI